MSLTTDPNSPCLKEGQKEAGQNDCYLVLSEEERAKGFTRPYRDAYVHKGRRVERKGEIKPLEEGLENLSDDAKKYYSKENGYAAFLKYPESESPVTGKFLTQAEYDALQSSKDYVGGCGALTTMGRALSETYARDPKFYGATFCVGCNKHIPVDEFVWDKDGEVLGS